MKKNANSAGAEKFLEGTTPVLGGRATIKKAASVAANPVRRLSFFERQQANDLGKALTPDGMHIDLSENSNRTSYEGAKQRQNKNALVDPVDKSLRPHAGEFPEGALGMHSRRCKTSSGIDVQGRTSCPVCKGIGFYAFQKQYEEKKKGISGNHSRHTMGEISSGPNGATAPANRGF